MKDITLWDKEEAAAKCINRDITYHNKLFEEQVVDFVCIERTFYVRLIHTKSIACTSTCV